MTGTTPPALSTAALGRPDEPSCPVDSQHDQIVRLTRAVNDLWQSEPDVAPSGRGRLLQRLGRLEHDSMRLTLQHHAHGYADDELLSACLAEADELRWWWRPTGRSGGRSAA